MHLECLVRTHNSGFLGSRNTLTFLTGQILTSMQTNMSVLERNFGIIGWAAARVVRRAPPGGRSSCLPST